MVRAITPALPGVLPINAIESANRQQDPKAQQLPIDQFDNDPGHFKQEQLPVSAATSFKNRLDAEIDAKKVADSIWSVISPAMRAKGCFEDMVEAFFASFNDKAARDKKQKMHEIEMLHQEENRIRAQQEKKSQEADRTKGGEQEQILADEQLAVQLSEITASLEKKNDELQQINQQIAQETQALSAILGSSHDAIMTTIRQMRDQL